MTFQLEWDNAVIMEEGEEEDNLQQPNYFDKYKELKVLSLWPSFEIIQYFVAVTFAVIQITIFTLVQFQDFWWVVEVILFLKVQNLWLTKKRLFYSVIHLILLQVSHNTSSIS